MRTTQHTPEPWQVNTQWLNTDTGNKHTAIECKLPGGFGLVASLEHCFSREQELQNAYRIVACVNACSSLSDPAADIAALREALREYTAGHNATGGRQCECRTCDQARAALARTERGDK